MSKFHFRIDPTSNQLKFQQLIDAVTEAISKNLLKVGDILPSVNQLCKESELSRDTVFKAYAELKNRGTIESVPNKGYFVAKATTKVFLFLDTFKAYKEVLYGSFLENLPPNVTVDLHFHHYNINVFETILKESIGKYTNYIVMNFDHERVPEIINRIPKNKLLIIDWRIHANEANSAVFQDFGETLYTSFKSNIALISKYNRFIYLYPEFTYHPQESITYFNQFCQDHQIPGEVLKDSKKLDIQPEDLYLMVSDRMLARFLDQCDQKQLTPGKDVGVISYNETPMKKYVKNGITVLSTDFELMGRKAAEFVTTGQPIHFCVPTKLTVRQSL